MPASTGLAAGGLKKTILKSNPHRHHDVAEIRVFTDRDQHAAVRVAERARHLFARQIGQHVEQIGHVKTDVQRFAGIADFDFLECFLLLRVGAGNPQLAVGQRLAHAAELLVGQDGDALQSLLQSTAFDQEILLIIGRYHTREIRKLPVDDLAHEFDVLNAEFDLGRRKLDADVVVAVA